MLDALFELITEVAPWLAPWLAPLAVIAGVVKYPEKAEKIIGWFLRLFNFGIKKLRQRSIRSSIQGIINDFARSINRQFKGVMPYNLQLRFVQSVDRAELSPDKRMVIVRIRDTLQDDRNLVNAMMSFCSIGVIPQARSFLSGPMNAAINITMTRRLLNDLKHYSALQYLHDEIIEGDGGEFTPQAEFCRMFDALDGHGLFTRVVLEEMREFGIRIAAQYPQSGHELEAEQFVQYVHKVATRQQGQELQEIGHRGRYMAIAFVLVGSPDTMAERGESPYLNHIGILRSYGYQKAYLAARGGTPLDSSDTSESASIRMARRLASSIQERRIGTTGRVMDYYVPDGRGKRRRQILIEVTLT